MKLLIQSETQYNSVKIISANICVKNSADICVKNYNHMLLYHSQS